MQTGAVGGERALALLPQRHEQLALAAQEGEPAAVLLAFAHDLEVEDLAVEGERAVHVRDVQPDVPRLQVLGLAHRRSHAFGQRCESASQPVKLNLVVRTWVRQPVIKR